MYHRKAVLLRSTRHHRTSHRIITQKHNSKNSSLEMPTKMRPKCWRARPSFDVIFSAFPFLNSVFCSGQPTVALQAIVAFQSLRYIIHEPFLGLFRLGCRGVPVAGKLTIRSQEKGVLAKGVSAESSGTPKATNNTQGYWAQQ